MKRMPAINHANDLARAHSLAVGMREQPLPPDVLNLIKIAAGCEIACGDASHATGRTVAILRANASHYLHLVMLFPGAPARRILGVNDDDSREVMLKHKRWLLRWLHPDRNRNAWETASLARVLNAWNELTMPAIAEARESGAKCWQELTNLPMATTNSLPVLVHHVDRFSTPQKLPWRPRGLFVFAALAMLIALAATTLIALQETFDDYWRYQAGVAAPESLNGAGVESKSVGTTTSHPTEASATYARWQHGQQTNRR